MKALLTKRFTYAGCTVEVHTDIDLVIIRNLTGSRIESGTQAEFGEGLYETAYQLELQDEDETTKKFIIK